MFYRAALALALLIPAATAPVLAETPEERAQMESMDALRPLLKHQLTHARQAILAMARDPGFKWRETQIRKPTGDTQKLRTVFTAMRVEEARFRKSLA